MSNSVTSGLNAFLPEHLNHSDRKRPVSLVGRCTSGLTLLQSVLAGTSHRLGHQSAPGQQVCPPAFSHLPSPSHPEDVRDQSFTTEYSQQVTERCSVTASPLGFLLNVSFLHGGLKSKVIAILLLYR